MLAVWPQCLSHFKTQISSEEEFNTWIKPLQVAPHSTDELLLLYAPNAFVIDRVRERYLETMVTLLRQVSGNTAAQIVLELGSLGPAPGKKTPGKKLANKERKDPFISNLDPHYTFDNFVEGKSNQMGKSAVLQVAQNPGRSYNPLLLYGSTGLGKTHLMHAAGNLMLKLNPEFRVLYLRSEQFFGAMMKALQEKTMDQFKRQFRHIDALLVDDVQFFAGKNTTQEEFFHTFNTLLDGKQQMILTCDRFPREMENLEPRLKSRLVWGLTCAIETPDFETRSAILMSKAQEHQIVIPDEVIFHIAKRIQTNVRDLEGALNTLVARSNFTHTPITLEFTQTTLRDLLHAQKQAVSLPNIQKVVADYYQLRVADLLSKRRTRTLARPRQLAMRLAKELTDHSLPEIGDSFGGRDHTTVIHACRQIDKLLLTDGGLSEDWDKLMRKLSE